MHFYLETLFHAYNVFNIFSRPLLSDVSGSFFGYFVVFQEFFFFGSFSFFVAATSSAINRE